MPGTRIAFFFATNLVLCSAFLNPHLTTGCGKKSLGLRAVTCSVSQNHDSRPEITRKNFGTILLGAMVQAQLLLQAKTSVAAVNSPLQDWKQDASNGFANYTALADGVKYKDIQVGVGSSPKAGDYVRFQLSAYLLDGTLVSSYSGVELSQITLGRGEIPSGLEQGLLGMSVGGRRVVVIPPAAGWTPGMRARAALALRPCSGACPLDSQAVVAVVSLEGYRRGECVAEGDLPISADTSALLSEGKVTFAIGSKVCPEGDVEVTASRLKAKSLIDGLKASGRLAPEPARPKTWLNQ